MVFNYSLPHSRRGAMVFGFMWVLIPVVAFAAAWNLATSLGDADDVTRAAGSLTNLGFVAVVFAFSRWVGGIGALIGLAAGILSVWGLLAVPGASTPTVITALGAVVGFMTPVVFFLSLRWPTKRRR